MVYHAVTHLLRFVIFEFEYFINLINIYFQFRLQEDGRRALEQLNGFELAGRPIKVGMVNDASTQQQESKTQVRSLESEEMDRAGVDLGTTGRLALMAKLAEGKGNGWVVLCLFV